MSRLVSKHLFCFGFGYVAKALARSLQDWKISGTHTSDKKLEEGQYFLENDSDFDAKVLSDVTHILISIPPTEDGDMVYLRFANYFQTLKNLRWIGYFSSTSVYGDHQGNWVNETSITNPSDSAGKYRLIAEKQWLSSDLPVNILRLSAIYGPNRSAFDAIKAGKARRIAKENHYFSRIYIKDLIEIIKIIIDNPNPKEIYNIADDIPSSQHEVVAYACKLMGVEAPPIVNFEDAELSEVMKNYYTSSKRVDNSKIKEAYKFKFNFPSYKEGLMDVLKKDA